MGKRLRADVPDGAVRGAPGQGSASPRRRYYSLGGAAKRLEVSRQFARRLVMRGDLVPYGLVETQADADDEGIWFFPREDVQHLARQRKGWATAVFPGDTWEASQRRSRLRRAKAKIERLSIDNRRA
jgi:hypothetical protein